MFFRVTLCRALSEVVPQEVNIVITQGWDKLHRLSQAALGGNQVTQETLNTNRSYKNSCRQPLQPTIITWSELQEKYQNVAEEAAALICRKPSHNDSRGQWDTTIQTHLLRGRRAFNIKWVVGLFLFPGFSTLKAKEDLQLRRLFVRKEIKDTKVQNKCTLHFWNNTLLL